MSKRKIKQLAVKIYKKSGAAIGTGVLYVPLSDGKYAYVFTAAHVAEKGIDKQYLSFKACVGDSYEEFETKGDSDIKLHSKYASNEFDVAVVRVEKEDWMMGLPKLVIGNPVERDKVEGEGFPQSARDKTLKFSMLPLDGTINTCSDSDKRFQIVLDNKLQDASKELGGYSGSGIYNVSEDDEELVLIGIFSYGQGVNATQNITNVFYSSLLIEICEENKWEMPELSNQAPSSFEVYIDDAVNIIESDSVRSNLSDLARYFVESGIKPTLFVKQSSDIYDIPECKSNNRMRCKTCWISRLKLISILAFIKGDLKDLDKPIIEIDSKKVPIDFFCSEGSEGKCQMKKVVHSIVSSGFIWKNKFRDNAILIWASQEPPTHELMCCTKMNRIVGDICNQPINKIKLKKYDTLYGEGKNDNLSIIHINKLMKAIDIEEIDEVEKNVMEVFGDAIR